MGEAPVGHPRFRDFEHVEEIAALLDRHRPDTRAAAADRRVVQ